MSLKNLSDNRLSVLYGLSLDDHQEHSSPPLTHSSTTRHSRSAFPPTHDETHPIHDGPVSFTNISNADSQYYSRGTFRFKKPNKSCRRKERGAEERNLDRDGNHDQQRQQDKKSTDGRADVNNKNRSTSEESKDNSRRHDKHRNKRRRKHVREHHQEKGFVTPPVSCDDPGQYDDTYLPNAQSFKFQDPDAAFRESLFDAMADDEGAAFWEGVYGQRIDTYPRPVNVSPQGVLEAMTDDQYAAYVREKMYEKSSDYINNERARREKLRAESKAKEKQRREESETKERLRRGRRAEKEAKKTSSEIQKRWTYYHTSWTEITKSSLSDMSGKDSTIPWPVASGKSQDISQKSVEEFYLAAPGCHTSTGGLVGLLKTERVRWHPDKIQQRWGELHEELTAVNTIFQTIDNMWSQCKGD